MMKRTLAALLLASAAACTPPAQQSENQTPAPTPPQEIACNAVAPDVTRQVAVEAPQVAVAGADLRGGELTPGTYDLTSARKLGSATGWAGTRAVALEVSEDAATGVVTLNWAGTTATSTVDRWSATLTQTPQARLTYTCGRVGDVEASFAAAPRALELQIADGANGELQLAFAQR